MIPQVATAVALAAAIGWLLLVARIRPSARQTVFDPRQGALLAPGLAVVLLVYLTVMVLAGAMTWPLALTLAAAAFLVGYLQLIVLQRIRSEPILSLRQWLLMFLGRTS